MFKDPPHLRLRGRLAASWQEILLRSLAFGAGFALFSGILVGGVVWWSERPKAWSSGSITGKPVELYFIEQDENLVIRFRYAITNNTNTDYEFPRENMGSLMGVLVNGSSLSKLEGATWSSNLRIPPKQSVVINFESPFKYSDYNTSKAELNDSVTATESGKELSPEFKTFIERRLKGYDGLVFLDYADKYRITLPSDWKDLHH